MRVNVFIILSTDTSGYAEIYFLPGTGDDPMIRRLLPASGIRQVFDKANALEKQGKKVFHLEIGRPDWKLPPNVEQAAIDALKAGFVHYLPNRGVPALRESISRFIECKTRRIYDPEKEIIVTLGGSEAVCMAVLALIAGGDEVIIPIPTWPHYNTIVQMAGGTPVCVPGEPSRGFVYNPDQIRRSITPKTRMIILNSPGNPTGVVQKRGVLSEIARIALDHNIIIMSDEVYQDFVYEGEHVSLAELVEDKSKLILINSFSKSFAMTGWRIGWTASDAVISDAMNRIHQYLTVCGVSFAQKGVASMLDDPGLPGYLQEMNDEFRRRYEVWRDAFGGLECVTLVPPGGAFYIFPEFKIPGMDAARLCEMCLNDIQVAMVPGNIFGEKYVNCVRISYGRDLETQTGAASRLVDYIRKMF
jgi:aminotransferase